MKTGIVKWFNDAKGFGFINDGNLDYFAHYKSINGEGYKTLKEGQTVTFETAATPKGTAAVNIEKLAE